MKKKPESRAYLVRNSKPTVASFLFTSNDRPTSKEGARSNFEPQHRQVSTHHRSGLSPLASRRFNWSRTWVWGCRAGQDPEASLSNVSIMIVICVCDFASQETCLCDYLCAVQFFVWFTYSLASMKKNKPTKVYLFCLV
jgi:hypothetical protein